jgi:hypothetical protein
MEKTVVKVSRSLCQRALLVPVVRKALKVKLELREVMAQLD